MQETIKSLHVTQTELQTKLQKLTSSEHGDHLYSELMKAREEYEESQLLLEDSQHRIIKLEQDLQLKEETLNFLSQEIKTNETSIETLKFKLKEKERETIDKERQFNTILEKEKSKQRELTSSNNQLSDTVQSLNATITKIRQDFSNNTILFERQLQKEQSRLENVNKNQKYLQSTIEKLIKAEETTVSSLTCTHCFQLFEDPCLLVPCSHTYCTTCWESIHEESGESCCPECQQHVHTVVRVGVLDGLAKKSAYRKEQLQSVCESVKHFFALQ